MKVLAAAILIVGTICVGVSEAQASPSSTVRAPGYDRLGLIVGRWTIKGREDKFMEVCRWYDGNFHVICETENKRADGAIGYGMSILGYIPVTDTYSYHGMGSNGRNETMTGTFADGILEFTAETVDNGAPALSRVRMGPFSEHEVPFVAESSGDRVNWTTNAKFTYVRLESPNPVAQDTLPLFAVQIRTGARWDAAKPPQEQRHFRDHSANLKRLRDAGHLVAGARYSEVGLVILTAESEAQARAMMDQDPSFEAGIFRYEVHPFDVFYSGSLQGRPRNPDEK